jgi:hypothetical protein
LFVVTNITKLNSEEKNFVQFSKNCRIFYPKKFVTTSQKIWVWDPGSGKNLFRIPDLGPGVKKAPDSGSATLLDSISIPGMNFYSLNPSKNLSSGMRKGKRKGIYEREVLTSSWSREN